MITKNLKIMESNYKNREGKKKKTGYIFMS